MKKIAMLLLPLLLLPSISIAQSAEEKGLEIATEADRRINGYVDFTAEMEMTLKNKHGQSSSRKIRIRTLEVEGDGDKSISIFDTPRDVKGTAFLTYSHKTGDDDQWLYLPALKRVKRISSRNKSGSFMGSEFAYEDISSEEIEKYRYKWVGDEVYDGLECFVIERYPVHKKYSGYTKLLTWIDKKEYNPQKVDYYDRKNSLLKTLTFKGYKKYGKKFWKPEELTMVNHQNGKSTKLVWHNYKFNTGLKERDFSKSSLKRMK